MATIPMKIKLACKYAGISESELARRIGSSSQSISKRLKTGRFTSEELCKIAAAIGCTFSFSFDFEDGTKI
ncbi:MAG: helix-turn-helix transcriptional regulator [Clostridia bacterium]|nr:helix-turn-helix transcriptional regulator [Clostridia bacterium]